MKNFRKVQYEKCNCETNQKATIKMNQTRFVILKKKGQTKNLNFNKASVKFEGSDAPF